MSVVIKTRDAIIVFVLLLVSFVRTSLGRDKPLPVSHADVPDVTQGLLFRHASGPAYLETAKNFPFLRYVKDRAPGAGACRILRDSPAPSSLEGWRRPVIEARESVSLRFGGPRAWLQRQYEIEFGGTFPYVRLSSAAIGWVGAALEFSPLRTSASADLRAYSLAVGPCPSINLHGALLDSTNSVSSLSSCCSCGCTDCSNCGSSCSDCSCACACMACLDCGCPPGCACCSSCDCSNCSCS